MAMENAQTISCPKCDLSVSSICSKCNKEVEVSQLANWDTSTSLLHLEQIEETDKSHFGQDIVCAFSIAI